MRTQPTGRSTKTILLLAAVASSQAVSACGSDEQKTPAACEAGDETAGPTGSTAAVRGNVSLRDIRDFTLDDMGQPMTLVQGALTGTFADFSTVTSTPSSLMLLGTTCVGIVSRPVSSGTPRRLDLESLVVGGTAIGEVTLARTSTGVFRTIGAQHLMPGATSIHIVGATEMDGFPAFDETLAAVRPMDLTTPKTDGTTVLAPNDLTIEWTAGDGDYIEISVVPDMEMGSTQSGGQVSCVALDDGCFVLPGAAATFLLASQTDQFTLSVERHRHRTVSAQSAGVDLDISSEVRTTLLNGVN